jgi:hypothetical protein
MNCEKTERLVYLYDELSPEEKVVVDTHLPHCKGCTALFQEAQHMRLTLHTVSVVKPEIKKPEQLTQNVLQAIKAGHRHKPTAIITSFLDSLFTRYAFAALSLSLMVFFIVEQQSEFHQDHSQFQIVKVRATSAVTLNTTSFLKASGQQQENETWKLSSLYTCLKTNDCDDSLIRNFKRKKTIPHENI